MRHILILKEYDAAEVGTIWEIYNKNITHPDYYIVTGNGIGTKWILKSCARAITKQEYPEYFI